ncbi:Methionine aminopeptidase (MAP) (Peptidase M) [Pseudovibrio sp. FO-BEG1]|uniref:Methionine aminopeptidase n=1 Tax=Pseudovibrio denitrificans TaxID=258256 RepID=A0A1I6ZRW7_9HYPH|nr:MULTISPECIES: type I methionyl aminopeptidase [Pseudovibrio]AEV38502.1 Methionine aminopeptidase (MAP) (Peptidase M) [Pseudovibrio sp. FO-BEG1]SFT65469.1 methionine aminopeptidase, type I [Pseudovibrio denitrificans]
MIEYVDAAKAPLKNTGQIKIYSQEDFEGMRKASQMTAQCLDALVPLVQPGVTTQDIDDFVFKFGKERGGVPATLNYRGYTKSCCTSINRVICHGIPDPKKKLKEGDIVNIDVTYIVDGWHGDSSRMYPVGKLKPAAKRLIEVTHESLMRALEVAKPGNTTGDIGHAIQEYVESERCSVVRDFCGHGVGKLFHDMPNILHYGQKGTGIKLMPGMIFTIEPMVNLGRPDVRVLKDGWTAETKDKTLSAQFEHSIGITSTGCDIFTTSPAGLFNPMEPETGAAA